MKCDGTLGHYENHQAFPNGCVFGMNSSEWINKIIVDSNRHGKVRICAANGRGLVGGSFKLDYPSVGATETLLLAASIAEGVTVLSNVARVCI